MGSEFAAWQEFVASPPLGVLCFACLGQHTGHIPQGGHSATSDFPKVCHMGCPLEVSKKCVLQNAMIRGMTE